MKLTVLPWKIWAVLILGSIALILGMDDARAEPRFRAASDGIVVTIYSEKCAVPAITNLPRRATWEQNGKSIEGCAGMMGNVMLFYFADRTVTAVRAGAFERVQGV